MGKTEYDNIQKRWKEHCRDYKKERYNKRPLYDAMNKYGIEHFNIEIIEYVSPFDNLEEREIYWVSYYNTYHNGYNATKGGDGKRRLNYQLIQELWEQGFNCKEISEKLKCDSDWVGNILKRLGISSLEIKNRQKI